tara:strand:- start:1369 stop:1698 length:330 start_codon:yes stop_codon:yes gene_type:complete
MTSRTEDKKMTLYSDAIDIITEETEKWFNSRAWFQLEKDEDADAAISKEISEFYAACAETLETAGMRPDGLPMQMGWREAGKLPDAALMSKIGGFDRFSKITETADYGR